MTFWARLIIYAGIVLLYVGTAAWIVRAWTRKRYRDKSPSDLHYIAVGIVLVVSAGLGVLVASQIVGIQGKRSAEGCEYDCASIVQRLILHELYQVNWCPMYPITGIAGYCARTASGQTVAPPSSVMNSRRCTAQCLPCFGPRKG
jgi:hypothetical protein